MKNRNVTTCFGFDVTSLPLFTFWLLQDLTRELLRAGMDATLPTFAGCFAMDCRKSGHSNVARLRDVSWNLFSLFVFVVPRPADDRQKKYVLDDLFVSLAAEATPIIGHLWSCLRFGDSFPWNVMQKFET